MVVVFIIGLLVAIVAPQLMSHPNRAMVKTAKMQIKSFDQAVRTFRLDNGRYPTSAEGLAALRPPPPADLPRYDPEGYIDGLPVDPWGRPYDYRSDGRNFEIVSFGGDGVPGGEGYDADLSSQRLY